MDLFLYSVVCEVKLVKSICFSRRVQLANLVVTVSYLYLFLHILSVIYELAVMHTIIYLLN